jgi:hypothetical protein
VPEEASDENFSPPLPLCSPSKPAKSSEIQYICGYWFRCSVLCSVQGRSEGVGYWGWGGQPPTFLELTYSENRVGHSENCGNSRYNEVLVVKQRKYYRIVLSAETDLRNHGLYSDNNLQIVNR